MNADEARKLSAEGYISIVNDTFDMIVSKLENEIVENAKAGDYDASEHFDAADTYVQAVRERVIEHFENLGFAVSAEIKTTVFAEPGRKFLEFTVSWKEE
ncbi:hypothetical protein J9303_01050 [Bacillaceae bacterium Marseille-Q3522]|nr:hypothetical protein [Bacillaceae bacterium Marseille-Q3522]